MTVSTSPVRTPLVIPYTDLYIWIVQYDRVYQSREDSVGDSVYRPVYLDRLVSCVYQSREDSVGDSVYRPVYLDRPV